MVQLSLGAVAACLPILRPVFTGLSLDSLIRTFRSAVSLRSTRSHASMSIQAMPKLWRIGRQVRRPVRSLLKDFAETLMICERSEK